MKTHDRTPEQEIERIARRRAGAKMSLFIHATIYIVVNLLLVGLSAMSGRHWAIFPVVGWGIGLAIHAFIVFMATGGGGLHERMLQAERNRLALQRDAW